MAIWRSAFVISARDRSYRYASYIAFWLKVLNDEKRAVFAAVLDALKGEDYSRDFRKRTEGEIGGLSLCKTTK